MTDFFSQVYDVVKLIPAGRVTSYGAIAACLGSPGAARMVGWALNASHHHPDFVPAHREVNRKGLLTGKHHFDTRNVMKELLENEGLLFDDNDQILNFKERFWGPAKVLDL